MATALALNKESHPLSPMASLKPWRASCWTVPPEALSLLEDPSLSAEGAEDSSSDAGAEIAEWMARSCILDDGNDDGVDSGSDDLDLDLEAKVEDSPSSADILKSVRTREAPPPSSPSSLSQGSESGSSQEGSPTSVLRNDAWDLLFAAAGEVQKLTEAKGTGKVKEREREREKVKEKKLPEASRQIRFAEKEAPAPEWMGILGLTAGAAAPIPASITTAAPPRQVLVPRGASQAPPVPKKPSPSAALPPSSASPRKPWNNPPPASAFSSTPAPTLSSSSYPSPSRSPPKPSPTPTTTPIPTAAPTPLPSLPPPPPTPVTITTPPTASPPAPAAPTTQNAPPVPPPFSRPHMLPRRPEWRGAPFPGFAPPWAVMMMRSRGFLPYGMVGPTAAMVDPTGTRPFRTSACPDKTVAPTNGSSKDASSGTGVFLPRNLAASSPSPSPSPSSSPASSPSTAPSPSPVPESAAPPAPSPSPSPMPPMVPRMGPMVPCAMAPGHFVMVPTVMVAGRMVLPGSFPHMLPQRGFMGPGFMPPNAGGHLQGRNFPVGFPPVPNDAGRKMMMSAAMPAPVVEVTSSTVEETSTEDEDCSEKYPNLPSEWVY